MVNSRALIWIKCRMNQVSHLVTLISTRPASKTALGDPFMPIKVIPVDLFPHSRCLLICCLFGHVTALVLLWVFEYSNIWVLKYFHVDQSDPRWPFSSQQVVAFCLCFGFTLFNKVIPIDLFPHSKYLLIGYFFGLVLLYSSSNSNNCGFSLNAPFRGFELVILFERVRWGEVSVEFWIHFVLFAKKILISDSEFWTRQKAERGGQRGTQSIGSNSPPV